jgi:hypothetical protein|nr:hypothetical protein [uncultured Nocardioides sp.]
MKSAFKILAYVIAALVIVQSAVMVFAAAGLFLWVEDGNALDSATMESEPEFTGAIGFMIHGMNGMMIIPIIGLALLVVSFFAKVPGGVRNAAIVLALIVLQVALGIFGHENAWIGLLHGINALVLFAAALHTGQSVKKDVDATAPRATASV